MTEFGLLGGFQAYEHHITRGHFLRCAVGTDRRQKEIAVDGIDLQAVRLHIFIIRMKQEMDFPAALGQPSAIVSSYGPGPYDCISEWSHVFIISETRISAGTRTGMYSSPAHGPHHPVCCRCKFTTFAAHTQTVCLF